MPISPDEARRIRHDGSVTVRQQLDKDLTEIVTDPNYSGLPLTRHLEGVPSDVAEQVVQEWRDAGWTKAQIVRDQRDGDYIRLN